MVILEFLTDIVQFYWILDILLDIVYNNVDLLVVVCDLLLLINFNL